MVEGAAPTAPIEAQSAAVARATANCCCNIGHDEWGGLGGHSGHARWPLTLSLRRRDPARGSFTPRRSAVASGHADCALRAGGFVEAAPGGKRMPLGNAVPRQVPHPCASAACSRAMRRPSSCPLSNWAGRPFPMARRASIPPASSRALHVYSVCRATPTAGAASDGVLPASISLPGRSRFRVDSSIRAMTALSARLEGRTAVEANNGCHG
jgi:hypothetical protein